MRVIEGLEVTDEELLPPGKHVVEEVWEQYGVKYIDASLGEKFIKCADLHDAISYAKGFTANGQAVKRTVVALTWETVV